MLGSLNHRPPVGSPMCPARAVFTVNPQAGSSSPESHQGRKLSKERPFGCENTCKALAGNSPGPRSAVFTQGKLPSKETKLPYEASDGENAFPESGKRAPALATGVAVEEFPEHSFS